MSHERKTAVRRLTLLCRKSQIQAIVIALIACLQAAKAETVLVIHKERTHLRSGSEPEWDEFKGKTPAGKALEVRFQRLANETAQSLFIEQSDVKLDWTVKLNGTNLGNLHLMEAPLVWSMRIPPGRLRRGENVLTIVPPKENDDIIVGPITIDPRPVREAFDNHLDVNVLENGNPVPARITITRPDGVLAALMTTNRETAFRPGVIYSANGASDVHLLPGQYVIQASRGPEYSVATKKLKLKWDERPKVTLNIIREVPTPGFASCDTHVHTWTYSKHGDATFDERMLTIAGEALELPVATDHNLIVDYSACAGSNHVSQYFTPIIGDEVTTPKGHFNGFPMRTGSAPPGFKEEHWPTLIESIRRTPDVQAVILNHPTDTHSTFCPFASTNFNRVTGENLRGPEFTFDAVELVNSGALRTDLMETFRCWFALLNYGYRITGIGGSDSHDVSRFIVGQGRTYIACNDSDPARIDINEVCRNLRAGKALVSLGLITNMRVNDRFSVGELATNLAPEVTIAVKVLGASWTTADHLELFANGIKLREERIRPTSKVQKAQVTWKIPRPKHDVHLIAVATGPGVTSAHWAIPRPYQPASTTWTSRILGASNPIRLDADGDGRFTAARQYASQIIERVGTDPLELMTALADFDEAVAAQAASLCQAGGKSIRSPEFKEALRKATKSAQAGFSAFAATLPAQN